MIQGSAPVEAPARGLKARESAAPLANGLVRAPSFHVHASHTAMRLSSPGLHVADQTLCPPNTLPHC